MSGQAIRRMSDIEKACDLRTSTKCRSSHDEQQQSAPIVVSPKPRVENVLNSVQGESIAVVHIPDMIVSMRSQSAEHYSTDLLTTEEDKLSVCPNTVCLSDGENSSMVSSTTRSYHRRPLRMLLRWLLRLSAFCLILFLLFVVVLKIGSSIQQRNVDEASPTDALYTTEAVCGLIESSTTAQFQTFRSIAQVQAAPNTTVAHCGDCGQCSNPQDIGIYDVTADTLYDTTYGCAVKTLLGGRGKGTDCMIEEVGLTPGCTDCWVNNIMCDLKKCAFVCLWDRMFHKRGGGTTGNPEALDPCTQCDELLCGPEFLQCAGANRRRAGIYSDLERESTEVCGQVESSWWDDPELLQKWNKNQRV